MTTQRRSKESDRMYLEGIAIDRAGRYNAPMTAPKNTEQCTMCGGKLYSLTADEELACTYCGTPGQASVKCSRGHYVCDACRGKDVRERIERTVLSARSADPLEIAEHLMANPDLPMLSCDHAFIAAGALLAALRNSPYGRITDKDIREAFTRTAKQAHDGHCGLTGVCGIAPAVGACVSLFLGAHCGTDREQKIVMDAVTQVSQAISDLTGPSCCKAYVRSALAAAVAIFSDTFGIALPVKNVPIVCVHVTRHPHGCREEKCPYFKRPSRDIFAEAGFTPGIAACVS